ncbi:flagellar hook-basal body complex protein FliE [Pseudodonghicola flavimaris]|uniref:Flagellar hook-basal body complex protein FliE n=1 Tax=Pseudodonghicola flavimaris TaxID=3050036 RepID=A0ABT7EWJ3_9RHOB|nr:flagellar hook-basal body complex protein FliE [Pseudodonghicola flavimaris]MDK3016711.1 flagellar hook-basal body complex protein FliE [Pseudodonghicola flavimaris]
MTDASFIRPELAIEAAYGKAKSLSGDAAAVAPAEGPSFGDMIRDAASSAAQTVRLGDATAAAGLTEKAGLQQVVEATMAMESTVRVSVALRDKLVDAYKDIMNMPI